MATLNVLIATLKGSPYLRSDVNLSQSVFAHDHLVHGHRVEQPVRDQHTVERWRHRLAREHQPIGGVAERGALRAARHGTRFDEVKSERLIEGGMSRPRGVENIG